MGDSLADKLTAERARLGLSRDAVARAAEVSRETVRNAELGNPIRADTRRRIERALAALADERPPARWRERVEDRLGALEDRVARLERVRHERTRLRRS